MREILVLSGKGGTGKTTLVGALAALMENKVLTDCDVDAADLHLLLNPTVVKENAFWSGVSARILPDQCTDCGTCFEICQFQAITDSPPYRIDPLSCEGCGVCAHFCPEDAIELKDNLCGAWYLSETPYGPMVHAALDPGEENSGKLVSVVKRESRELAEKMGAQWILSDGPPGIGCPVISSLSGANLVVVVTEPSNSGLHDLHRVLDLVSHFKIPAGVCINKWDLNTTVTRRIEDACASRNVRVLGLIPFDPLAVDSLVAGKPVVEYHNGPAAAAVRGIWKNLEALARQVAE